jgi:hypothetical protein
VLLQDLTLPLFYFLSFPVTLVRVKGTIFKYIPCAISASDAPLKEITALSLRGKTGYEIYQEKLKVLLKNDPNK